MYRMIIKNEHFTNTLDLLGIERHKCKDCGGDIIYDNTYHTNYDGKLKIHGKSYKTIKNIDGVEYKLKVCQNCLLNKFPDIKNLSRVFGVMCEATKYAFEIPDNIYLEKRKNYAMTKEKMIKKYGEVEGQKKWDSYCKRQAETNSFEYKQKIHGWNREQFDEYNKSRAVTLKNLIKTYGEIEGQKKWDSYCKKQTETKSWDYMVEKYGIEQARNINKSKSLTLCNFIKKYGEIEGQKKWINYLTNRSNGVSKISQKLFNELDKYISNKYMTYYNDKNGEYFVWCDNKIYYMDYFIKDLNICIEFNGSCFHGDERVYGDEEYCNPFNKGITAKELRELDQERYTKLYKTHGIKRYVIWELDYNPNNFNYIDYITNTLNIKL